jgi:hypothetical protein
MFARRPLVVSFALLALPLMAACKNEPVANQPVRQRGVQLGIAVPEESPAQLPTPMEQPLVQITATDPPPATTTAEEAAPDEPEKPARNMQSELETMMGSPVNCLTDRSASEANPINISLNANVMPSGAVGRGEVSAPGLTPAEVSCIRSKLESMRFAQPIENAPLVVTGSISLTPHVAAPAPAPAAAPAADGGSMYP